MAAFFAEVRLANHWTLEDIQSGGKKIRDRQILKEYLEYLHIKKGLLEPYDANYPLIDARELLPSFEINFAEYKHLPSFSMVAFNRPLEYQREVFQFDLLHRLTEVRAGGSARARRHWTPERLYRENLEKFLPHLSRELRQAFRERFLQVDLTDLAHYEELLSYLFHMDRAHVIARDPTGEFCLLGCYASFPSDLDTELKNFGRRIGKFKPDDNLSYEKNRPFVYQFLMELYGFPISSERRTSSALFARKLSRLKDSYLIKVLGSSDRVITTLDGFEVKAYPQVEKTALLALTPEQAARHPQLRDQGFYLDPERRILILKVFYKQHRYNPNNVQEDRALSVVGQEVIHPITGQRLPLNLIKDTQSFLVILNDIIRGEYRGSISYRREGVVTSTKNHDDRLKFLSAWLTKNQRRLTSYSLEFFAELKKILNTYILNPDNRPYFQKYAELHREVLSKVVYLQQLCQVQHLEKIVRRRPPYHRRLTLTQVLDLALGFLSEHYEEIIHYYEDVFAKCLVILDQLLALATLKAGETPAEPEAAAEMASFQDKLRQLQELKANLLADRQRLLHAEENGTFVRFLWRERLSFPVSRRIKE